MSTGDRTLDASVIIGVALRTSSCAGSVDRGGMPGRPVGRTALGSGVTQQGEGAKGVYVDDARL